MSGVEQLSQLTGGSVMTNPFVENIVWPEKPPVTSKLSEKEWAERRKVVEMLCGLATKVSWWGNGEGSSVFARMPSAYLVDGVKISFHPHIEMFSVGGVELHVLRCPEDVHAAIRAVLFLKEMGLEVQGAEEFH